MKRIDYIRDLILDEIQYKDWEFVFMDNLFDDPEAFETAKRIAKDQVKKSVATHVPQNQDNVDKWLNKIAAMINGLKIKDFL